jgi:hypothetical protein
MQVSSQDQLFKLEANHSAVVSAKTGYVQLKGAKSGSKPVYLKDDQAFIRARQPKRVEFSPATATTVTFGGSQQITEFRIYEQDDIEQCLNLTLRGTITKTQPASVVTANASLVEPCPLWIDRIEILVNGSTTIIHTIYGDQLWNALSTLPTEQLKTTLGQNLVYMGTDFRVNNSVGSSTGAASTWDAVATAASSSYSRMFAIPLFGTVLEKFRLRALDGDTIIRIYWNPNIAAAGPAGGVPTRANPATAAASLVFSLTNMQLVFESEEVLQKDKLAHTQLLKSSCLYVKYIEPVVQTFTASLASGQETPYQLTAMYGNFVAMQVYLRFGTGLNAPLSLTYSLAPDTLTSTTGDDSSAVYGQINFTDSSNKPLFTPSGYKPYDLRYHQYAQHMPNEWANSIPWYQVNFCETPVAALQKGVVDGYASFSGNEYVRITPGGNSGLFSGTNGFANAAVTSQRIIVVGWKLKCLKIENGKATVM